MCRCWGVLLAAAVMMTAGCPSLLSDGETPQVLQLRMTGQAPDLTTAMLMEADFFDPDGDLGNGSLTPYINASPTGLSGLPMHTIFVDSGVNLDATEGTLRFVLELSLGSTLPESGSQFNLGVVVTDEAGHESERTETRVALSY